MANEKGVWRTIGGRRVFIKEGQDLASAMKESGKFKSASKGTAKKEMTKEEKVFEDFKNSDGSKENFEKALNKISEMEYNNEINPDEYKNYISKIQKEYVEKNRKAGEENDLDKVKRIQGDLDKKGDKLTKEEKAWKEQLANTQKELESGKSREDIIKDLDREALRNTEKEYGELSKKMQADDYYYKPEDDRKLKELRAKADSERARQGIDTQEKYDKLMSEDSKASKNEQFEVSDLKKKAQATLPKEDIDTHEGDLYLKKTKESTELLNNMKDKDSGLLTTFKDQETGETWYDIPFANMGDDYKEKSSNDIMNEKIRSRGKTEGTNKYKSTKHEGFGDYNDDYIPVYDNKIDYTGDFSRANLSKLSNEELTQALNTQSEEYHIASAEKLGDQRTRNGKMDKIFNTAKLQKYEQGSKLLSEELDKRNLPRYNIYDVKNKDMILVSSPTREMAERQLKEMYSTDKSLQKQYGWKELPKYEIQESKANAKQTENKMTNALKRQAYKNYMKQHPNSKMSFEEFKDMNKK